MLDDRRMLLAALMVLTAFTPGCPFVVAGTSMGSTYVVGSEPATAGLTAGAHLEPAKGVVDAVTEWMNRGQLPLPVMGDGVHAFYLRAGKLVPAGGAQAARVVELFDGQQLVAEYGVAWDRAPVEYQLIWARNLLYEGTLDVSKVPVIKTYELR
ncbi:MAG TPA: hypothetical protein VMZ92_19820 [Planctomycetota bacterium]|nr:hypothetical protein [Planctomycetota bacterium]